MFFISKMSTPRIKLNVFNKFQMQQWRELNNIPSYINASYNGPTGIKISKFPTYISKYCYYPDVTEPSIKYEEEIIQELKDILKKPFGYIRALWHMSQQFGTGEPWDSKFMPQFPGRNVKGIVEYAKYNDTIVSANDLSNIIYGHICAYMKLPKCIAKLMARLDACGITEILTKRRFPDIHLRNFKDTSQDQQAIVRGVEDFKIKNYRLI